MKKVTVSIVGKEINLDFEGFAGDSCSDEENAFRVFLEKMGVKTNVIHSDNKQEKETEFIPGKEQGRS